MEGFVGDSFEDCQLCLFADADHAGEHDTTALLKGHTQTGTLQPFSGHCAVATRFVLCGTRSGRACSQKGL